MLLQAEILPQKLVCGKLHSYNNIQHYEQSNRIELLLAVPTNYGSKKTHIFSMLWWVGMSYSLIYSIYEVQTGIKNEGNVFMHSFVT